MKPQIRALVDRGIARLREAGTLPADIAVPEFTVERPKDRAHGDFSANAAMLLAKAAKTNPRALAQALVEALRPDPAIAAVEVAGPGFVNIFLDRPGLLRRLLVPPAPAAGAGGPKTIVEHTNINPNKAAHIGHLRNAVLGDILVRCLRALESPVEVQNYIDDTGVQVADVVVGVLHLPEPELAAALDIEVSRRDELIGSFLARLPQDAVPAASTRDFDDLCWEIYPRVTARYEADPGFATHRDEVLHAVEGGPGEVDLEQAEYLLRGAVISGEPYSQRAIARLAAEVAAGNLRCHLATMARLGVAYDLLPHESDILHLGFCGRPSRCSRPPERSASRPRARTPAAG